MIGIVISEFGNIDELLEEMGISPSSNSEKKNFLILLGVSLLIFFLNFFPRMQEKLFLL